MKKKGFTLMELLAVIAILALIVLLILPNVMKLFKSAKQKSFESELKEIYKQAANQWAVDSIYHGNKMVYARTATSSCEKELKLDGRKDLAYYIEIDKDGNVVKFYATDGVYQYSYKGSGLKVTQIKDAKDARESNKKITITCTVANQVVPPPSSSSDYLMSVLDSTIEATYLRTSIKKKDIETVTFTDSFEGHTVNGTDCWDVSQGQTGAVLAWATDSDSNGKYELTIGGDGKVFAASGANLFHNLINVTAINGMEYLDLSQVTSMVNMFEFCESLLSIDLSGFETSKVKSFGSMFDGCKSLKVIDVSHFDTSSATVVVGMFQDCENVEVLNVGHFDVSKVVSLDAMFMNCKKLTSLDLTRWDTSKVYNMNNMFNGCDLLTSLDLRSFDTSKVTYASWMFGNCNNLKTIYASDSFDASKITYSNYMFAYSSKIVGGAGTRYNSGMVDKTYAHIDGGTSNPGYFTNIDSEEPPM